MQDYELTLHHAASQSFRCQKAANSVDIDAAKKLTHHIRISADVTSPFNVGLIVGASGSGKTTLAKHIWGEERLQRTLDPAQAVIDQFPQDMDYADCVRLLTGVGLSSVPCWIRPAYTLSNGQRERAEIALKMATAGDLCVVDEWTSVVDRTVGKVMSHAIQKWARKHNRSVVLCSCHYDVADWLQPDWIIDCNKQDFTDRRGLPRQRTESLTFDIRRCDKSTWRYFAQYHYLSDRLPAGKIETFGLYHGADQIGFQCFANYVPYRREWKHYGRRQQMHSNRTVIHPDYVGIGLGILLINETSAIMSAQGYDVRGKFTSLPVYAAMSRDPHWELLDVSRKHKIARGSLMARNAGFRIDVTTYSFRFKGDGTGSPLPPAQPESIR